MPAGRHALRFAAVLVLAAAWPNLTDPEAESFRAYLLKGGLA